MRPILVVYATREGHTRAIAEHVAASLRQAGAVPEVIDAAHPPADLDLARYEAVILAASIHAGKHEREMTDFVRNRRDALERLPTVLLSSSLTEAGAEDPQQSPERRDAARAEVGRMIDEFFEQTGWRATIARPIAGALLYTQYGWFMRLVMKRIVKGQGGNTDTSRDYDYTDWVALDRFVTELLASNFRPEPSAVA